jgi:hypothetical protein
MAYQAAGLGGLQLLSRTVISDLQTVRRPVDTDPSLQNAPEGGWGLRDGYASDVLDTALALTGFPAAGLLHGSQALDEEVTAGSHAVHPYAVPEGTSAVWLILNPFSGHVEARLGIGAPPDLGAPALDITGPITLLGLPTDPETYYLRLDGIAGTSEYDLTVRLVVDGIDTIAIAEALDYLRASQNTDGGWGTQRGVSSDVSTTATTADAIRSYETDYDLASGLSDAAQYLVAAQSATGSWGGESVVVTAQAYSALQALGVSPTHPSKAETFLYYSQLPNGSWANDPYVTALVARLALDNPGLDKAPGDCNGDGVRNAGDLSALVLEIFDGDGSHRGSTPGGTFAGFPLGCDANGDLTVNAGDLSCTVLQIFNGPGACG